jgi:hypothetical protein
MTEHSKEVELGGETFEVVYLPVLTSKQAQSIASPCDEGDDDEDNLVYKRQTEQELKEAIGGKPDDFEYRNDYNTWGYGDHIDVEAFEELADRQDIPVGDVYVTPEYLRAMAEEIEMAYGPRRSCRLRVAHNLPVLVTKDADDHDTKFILCPRVKNSEDSPYFDV